MNGDFLNTSRRAFFKVSLLGSAVLFIGSSLSTVLLSQSSHSSEQDNFRFLRPVDVAFLLALAPAVLKANFPARLGEKANYRLLIAIDQQVSSLAEHSQQQLRQLFDLLTSSSLRYFTGAPTGDWSTVSTEKIDDFLLGWKNSMFSLKRTGYAALVKLISMSWYSQAENYQQAGYPGPPKIYLPEE